MVSVIFSILVTLDVTLELKTLFILDINVVDTWFIASKISFKLSITTLQSTNLNIAFIGISKPNIFILSVLIEILYSSNTKNKANIILATGITALSIMLIIPLYRVVLNVSGDCIRIPEPKFSTVFRTSRIFPKI